MERSRGTLAVLRANAVSLGVESSTRVLSGDAISAVRRLGRAGEQFDLVLVDPPYASGVVGGVLEGLVEAGVLAPGAVVVLERSRRHSLPVVAGLGQLDERRYGETLITRFTLASPGVEESGTGAGGSPSA